MTPPPSAPDRLEEHLLHGFAPRAIRQKARQLAGRHGFSLSERDDIEQELRLHLLRRLDRFDPQIAHWNVFVRTLLERHTATLVARRQVRLLRTDVAADPVVVDEHDLDLSLDIRSLLATLPRHGREICERLKKYTITEVARQLGVPRSTLRDEIKRLRGHFQDVELPRRGKTPAVSLPPPVDK